MFHIHWVARQNKLEVPRDKDEVNKREIHECDGRAHELERGGGPGLESGRFERFFWVLQ